VLVLGYLKFQNHFDSQIHRRQELRDHQVRQAHLVKRNTSVELQQLWDLFDLDEYLGRE
jgi:hypothetical protein